MSKSKQHSAAQRREQARHQRQQRLNTTNEQNRNRGSRKRQRKNNPWPLIAGIVVAVAVVIGIFFYLLQQQTASVNVGSDAAFHTITTMDPKLLATVGPGSAKSTMHAINDTKLTGPTGKPEFLYVGGEFCPYCAAQRWSIIMAVSRFGHFDKPLTALTSSESNVPTFTFRNIQYSSQYIDFTPVETSDNQNQPLDKLTPQQQALFNKYDQPPYVAQGSTGSIPFINIANQQVSAGAYYDPTTLVGHSYQDIANQVKDSNSDISRGMVGTANILTAALCAATNNQPANVCTADPIPAMQSTLPKASLAPGGPQLAAIGTIGAMDIRRRS